jgi:hypothetical protein
LRKSRACIRCGLFPDRRGAARGSPTGTQLAKIDKRREFSGGWLSTIRAKEIKLTAPVFCGDTLYAQSEVLEKRESKSRPTQGIVTVHTRAFNQDGAQVMEFVRGALIPKRGHGVDDKQ